MLKFRSTLDALIHGASFLVNPIQNLDIPSDEEALRSDWEVVGLDIKKAFGGYENAFKK